LGGACSCFSKSLWYIMRLFESSLIFAVGTHGSKLPSYVLCLCPTGSDKLSSCFYFILLLCWVGAHCGIYRGFYSISDVSFLNSPSPPCVSFAFESRNFGISFQISSMTYWSLRSVLFSLHEFDWFSCQ
jgi:hypothetical protein